MKWLCIILAFLVLGLSVQPVCAAVSPADRCCAADQACDDDHRTSHKEEQDCAGACNPFQQCSCCITAMIVPYSPAVTMPLLLFTAVTHHSSLLLMITEEPLDGFWQPPRLPLV